MELLGKKEENSVSVCLCGCIMVYMNCGIKNLVEMSHVLMMIIYNYPYMHTNQ